MKYTGLAFDFILVILLVFINGCIGLGGRSNSINSSDSYITRTNYETEYHTVIKADYVIGAFNTNRNGKSGCENFDMVRIINFLNSIPSYQYKEGDIITIDGLKYKKRGDIVLCSNDKNVGYGSAIIRSLWDPYANPPEPVLEDGEDRLVHQEEYFKWINDHPHLDYPPSPVW